MKKSLNFSEYETKIYDFWLKNKCFESKINENKKPYTIIMPPPNITGQLHIGHALNCTIQDAIIRFKRMQGYEVLWVPGIDHASIATENKIILQLKKEGLTKEKIGRKEFLLRAQEWKDKYGNIIINQLKKLGLSCDWNRLAFTLDEQRSKAVKKVFFEFYKKGLIYQGERLINWCLHCKTAISDAEVVHKEINSFIYFLLYKSKDEKGEDVIIATTRPETVFGDVALAINPKDKRYSHLIGKEFKVPLTNRYIPMIADEYVDMKFGTGVLKITPAHDYNDYDIGKKHNLPFINIISTDAKIVVGIFKGENFSDAEKLTLEALKKHNLLIKVEKYKKVVGHCYRCNHLIQPIMSKQWFVKTNALAKKAIETVKNKKINFIPSRFVKIYYNWLENNKDWCISRQLWWGHRIPVYYCLDCKNVNVAENEVHRCFKCNSTNLKQDEDVLDTWFSAALWPFSVLGYPNDIENLKYFYPTDVLVTAYDIIFFWVARMIFSGLEIMNEIPFKEVLINGIVRDNKGEKMSKSKNNGIDPLEIINKYGADCLRFSLLYGNKMGRDIKFSIEKINNCKNFLNKIFNAAKFTHMYTSKLNLSEINLNDLSLIDKWILTELSIIIEKITKYYEKFEFGYALKALYEFIWNKFCDWYIELIKIEANYKPENLNNNSLCVLKNVFINILKLLHPIIPFLTEELYFDFGETNEILMKSTFPTYIKKFKTVQKEMQVVFDTVTLLRNYRNQKKIANNEKINVNFNYNNIYLHIIKNNENNIKKLVSVNNINYSEKKSNVDVIMNKYGEIFIELNSDVTQIINNLLTQKAKLEFEINRSNNLLSNSGFLAKAPNKLILTEKNKLDSYKNQYDKCVEEIKKLKGD